MAKATNLGRWLRRELQERELTQNTAAVYAGVAPATLSGILTKGHVPKVETLFRLADYFEASREEILRLAGHLPALPGRAGAPEEDEALIGELIEEFRRVPDGWKEMVVEQVALVRRMAERPPYRFIGGEEEGLDDAGQVSDETAAQAA